MCFMDSSSGPRNSAKLWSQCETVATETHSNVIWHTSWRYKTFSAIFHLPTNFGACWQNPRFQLDHCSSGSHSSLCVSFLEGMTWKARQIRFKNGEISTHTSMHHTVNNLPLIQLSLWHFEALVNHMRTVWAVWWLQCEVVALSEWMEVSPCIFNASMSLGSL